MGFWPPRSGVTDRPYGLLLGTRSGKLSNSRLGAAGSGRRGTRALARGAPVHRARLRPKSAVADGGAAPLAGPAGASVHPRPARSATELTIHRRPGPHVG